MPSRFLTDKDREQLNNFPLTVEENEFMCSLIEPDAQRNDIPSPLLQDIDDNDVYVRNAIQQGYLEARSGNVLTEEEFWKAVAEDCMIPLA